MQPLLLENVATDRSLYSYISQPKLEVSQVTFIMWKLFLILALATVIAQEEITKHDIFDRPPTEYNWGKCGRLPDPGCICNQGKLACRQDPPDCYPCRMAFDKTQVCKIALDHPIDFKLSCPD